MVRVCLPKRGNGEQSHFFFVSCSQPSSYYLHFVTSSYLNEIYEQLPEPKSVWEYFLKVTQIPRGSNQEGENWRHKQILAFLKKTAEDLGYETYVDKGDNLIVRKPAYPGTRFPCSVFTRRL